MRLDENGYIAYQDELWPDHLSENPQRRNKGKIMTDLNIQKTDVTALPLATLPVETVTTDELFLQDAANVGDETKPVIIH